MNLGIDVETWEHLEEKLQELHNTRMQRKNEKLSYSGLHSCIVVKGSILGHLKPLLSGMEEEICH